MNSELTLAHRRLIDAVAKAVAADYLRMEALRDKGSASDPKNPVPLPAADKAA